jgi:hypothetical protein
VPRPAPPFTPSPASRPRPRPRPAPCAHDSIACTLQLLLFFFIAIFALPPRHYLPDDPTALAFFKMPVLFLMLITVLNDGTLITVAYDNVNPSKEPEKWNLKALWWAAGRGGGGRGQGWSRGGARA